MQKVDVGNQIEWKWSRGRADGKVTQRFAEESQSELRKTHG